MNFVTSLIRLAVNWNLSVKFSIALTNASIRTLASSRLLRGRYVFGENVKLFSILVIIIFIISGCQSTFKPKLNSAEKYSYQSLKKQFKGDPMEKYVDIFFIKSCEDLWTYTQQVEIIITSVEGTDIFIETLEKRTMKMNINNLDCSSLLNT